MNAIKLENPATDNLNCFKTFSIRQNRKIDWVNWKILWCHFLFT